MSRMGEYALEHPIEEDPWADQPNPNEPETDMTIMTSELMTSELKSCPFCGGEAVCHQNTMSDYESGWYWAVWCSTCGASTECHGIEDDAIKAWNTRKGDIMSADKGQNPCPPKHP